MVPEGDIAAIMRRLDADGDDEISFSDFFQGLLPYFIYGDVRQEKTPNANARKAERKRVRSENKQQLLTINVSRKTKSAKPSASGAAARKAPPQESQIAKSLEEPGFVGLRLSPRGAAGHPHARDNQRSQKCIATTLFSQERPELYFHRKTADTKFDLVRQNTYAKPLMQFFHSCIDFERRTEINKQELVLCEDFNIYNVFKALAGAGRTFLALIDLHGILNRYFGVPYSYPDMKLAFVR